MQITPADRIKKFIDNQGISKYEFCKKCGFSNGFLDKTKELRTDNLRKIIDNYPIIDLEWLLTGKGEMFKKNNYSNLVAEPQAIYRKQTPSLYSKENKANTYLVDYKASAGYGMIGEDIQGFLHDKPSIQLPQAPNGLNVAFQIEGDSMHPTIRHLDFVAANKVRAWEDIRDGYTYIVVDKDDGILCKRIYRLGNDLQIVSDNQKYPPYNRHRSKILQVFKAFCRLSFDFRNYHDDVRVDIQNLQIQIDELSKKII